MDSFSVSISIIIIGKFNHIKFGVLFQVTISSIVFIFIINWNTGSFFRYKYLETFNIVSKVFSRYLSFYTTGGITLEISIKLLESLSLVKISPISIFVSLLVYYWIDFIYFSLSFILLKAFSIITIKFQAVLSFNL